MQYSIPEETYKMLYHYKGHLIVYSKSTDDYSVYINGSIKHNVQSLCIASMMIDLMGEVYESA